MANIKEVLKKYNINRELPQKYEEIEVIPDINEIMEYHKETHDNNEVHVFTSTPDERGQSIEYIIDTNNYKLTILTKKDGEQIFGVYTEYKYDETTDDIQTTHS